MTFFQPAIWSSASIRQARRFWPRASTFGGAPSVLRLNYRTTEQIRCYANALLPDRLRTDDGDDETRHTVSLLSGPVPEVLAFRQPPEETQSLAERLRYLLKNGFRSGDIAVFTRTRAVRSDGCAAKRRRSA